METESGDDQVPHHNHNHGKKGTVGCQVGLHDDDDDDDVTTCRIS